MISFSKGNKTFLSYFDIEKITPKDVLWVTLAPLYEPLTLIQEIGCIEKAPLIFLSAYSYFGIHFYYMGKKHKMQM